MHKQSMIIGLICLGMCSCQRIVWTAKPVIESADKSDLSLAGGMDAIQTPGRGRPCRRRNH